MLASIFPRLFLPQGAHVDLDWPAFVEQYLSRHDVRGRKDGQLFSFAVYDGTPQRLDANVRAMTGVVIDFDNSQGVGNDARCIDKPSMPADHADNLDSLTYAYYSTHSHEPLWPRWRLCLPLDREVLPNEWQAVVAGVFALLGHDDGIDTTCKDLSRAYYTPSVAPASAEHAFHGFVQGKPISADEMIALGGEPVPPPNVTRLPTADTGPRANGRNDRLKAIVAAMIGRGDPFETIVLEMLKEDAKHNPPLFTDRTEGFQGDAESGAALFVARIYYSLNARKVRSGEAPDPLYLRGLDNSFSIPAPSADGPAFLFMVDEAVRDMRAPQWLVKRYFEQKTLAVMYGEPGAGKSFIALDLCLHIATGRAWHRHRVAKAPVIYVCGEGHSGVARRVKAWQMWHDIELAGVPLALTRMAVPMFDPRAADYLKGQIGRHIETLGGEAPALIVFDTVARNFGAGDENSTKDMMVFVDHIYGAAIEPFGTAALLVHHSGKDSTKGARGSSALKGAVDAEYFVKKCEGDVIEFRAEKMKDAELPKALNFELRPVKLPLMDEGEPVYSVVPIAVDGAQMPVITIGGIPRSADSQNDALQALHELMEKNRATLTLQDRDPSSARVLSKDWMSLCIERGICNNRQRFHAIKNAIHGRGLIRFSGGWVDFSDKEAT